MKEDQLSPWLETLSMPVAPTGEKFVKLSGLSERNKRIAWAEISQNHPGLAELLRSQEIKSVIQMFDADLYVEAAILPMLPPEQLKGRARDES